ncbi:hypothetical protein N9018_00120 [Rhodopirellula sp.]|nr:hypothetical protein [Rhodopirellula sp.]MDB4476583.1 hypothetical protein [Rhodopirellula sp.]MDB4532927.1 hypothetical protein [bacterium]MDC0326155.1 hypothetical protein [bacterium]
MSIASEAGMYATTYRIMTWMMILVTTIAGGCRGAQKFGRQVQVSKSNDVELTELDSPEQRLASSLRSEAAGKQSGETSLGGARSLEVRPASLQKNADSAAEKDSAATAKVVANVDSIPKKSVPQSANVAAEAKSNETLSSDLQAPDVTQLRDASDVIARINSLPAEERERIRQQLKSELVTADRTTQPNPIDLASGAMGRLPVLPPSRDSVPEVTPSRIGVGLESDQAAADNVALKNVQPTALSEQEKDAVAQKLLQNYADVANAESGTNPDRTTIRTVSATQSESAHSRIVQAFSRDLLSELSEDVLYDALAQQLSIAPAGEEPAVRTARLIRLRHLLVLSGDPDAAVEKISGLTEAEQEFLRYQLLGLWTIIDPDGHPTSPSRRFTSAIPQIREAAKFAAAATDALEVRALAFCTDIQSYGQFKRFEGNRFDAGQQVILYCEIDNFTAKRVDGGFETHLQGSYDIYDSENRKVLSQLLPADQQVSSNYLRDYFIAYQMLIPQELPAGTYKLRLTMEDRNGKKYGNSDIPFEIAK